MSGAEERIYSPLKRVEDVLPILDKISILAGLSDKQLRRVCALLKTVSYREGEFVFHQGEAASHIYIIEKGLIKIVVNEESQPLELIVFSEGKCFGETAVLGIQPQSAAAVAIEDTKLMVLSREALLSIFDADKELFSILILNIAREACRRLHNADEVLLHYVLKK